MMFSPLPHPNENISFFQVPDDPDDDDDDRPECEYGVNCYRKNPQHRRDFKHTHKPNPKRRAKAKKQRKDEDEEDDDYDSSFIDDDSMADISHDEESEDEYIPSDDDD
jgi:aprataxin and PNK-like factor